MSAAELLRLAGERRLLRWRGWEMLPLWPAAEDGALTSAFSLLAWRPEAPALVTRRRHPAEILAEVELLDVRPPLDLAAIGTEVLALAEALSVAARLGLEVEARCAPWGTLRGVPLPVRAGVVVLADGQATLTAITSLRLLAPAELPTFTSSGWAMPEHTDQGDDHAED